MRTTSTFLAALLVTLAAAPAARAQAAGPVIELAPEHRDGEKPPEKKPIVSIGAGRVPDAELVRGLTEQRFRSAEESAIHTSIGGYGEFQVTGLASGKDAKRDWHADLSRMVLFVAHSFNDKIRAYTEFEVEHAKGFEVEQALVDWKVWGDKIGLRAGLLLVPMGIINQWHEPPIFNGVVRPAVDTVIIPSTWRELGGGIFGRPTDWLRYELYGVTGLNPTLLGVEGLREARQEGAQARAKAWAVTGRVEVEPLLGFVVGASGYAGAAGGNANFYLRDRTPVDLSVPVLGFSADARFRRHGLEWKVVYAEFHIPEAEALMHAFNADGTAVFADASKPVPSRIRGGYVEGGYDVFRPFGLSHQLVPFARLEFYDTQSAVPEGYTANPTFNVREYTFGLSYRPIQQIVAKLDYQLRNRRLGKDDTQVNFGVGFMY